MKTVEESVAMAMDCTGRGEILPYLPYILQDFWELGSNPETIINLIKRNYKGEINPKVLDLGCGKGAISVNVAKELRYKCYGIDAIPEFISFAEEKAEEFNVADLCRFEVGDIREIVKSIECYHIIILGAIGPVFGDYYQTLTTLKSCLSNNGIIVIDDGYTENDSKLSNPLVLKREIMLEQIERAGMKLADEVLGKDDDSLLRNYETEYYNLSTRCDELIQKYPDKKELFSDYKNKQKEEYSKLISDIICSTMVMKAAQ